MSQNINCLHNEVYFMLPFLLNYGILNLKDNHFLTAFFPLYPASQDTLYLITLMQLAFIMLYATTGHAGDTLVLKDIIHNNSYTTSVIHTVCHNGQSCRLSGSLGRQPHADLLSNEGKPCLPQLKWDCIIKKSILLHFSPKQLPHMHTHSELTSKN